MRADIKVTAEHFRLAAEVAKAFQIKNDNPALIEKAAEILAQQLLAPEADAKGSPAVKMTHRVVPPTDTVKIDGELCYFPAPIQPFIIDLSCIKTPEALLSLIELLTTKNWMTPLVLNQFIKIAAKHKGWKV